MMNGVSMQLGCVELFLPDATGEFFWFGHDVAKLLGLESNSEARSVLEGAIAQDGSRPTGALESESEADEVVFRARSPARIVHVVQVLHRLAGLDLPQAECASVLARCRAWRRPSRNSWSLGDLFMIPLKDATVAFGQVVGVTRSSPTLLLFEGRAPAPLPVGEVLELGFATVLHTDGSCLDSGDFAIFGNAEPCVDAASGPWGPAGRKSTADTSLQELANAWYGLEPWNILAEEDYWDRLLFGGRPRPSSAHVLSPEERAEYRRARFSRS